VLRLATMVEELKVFYNVLSVMFMIYLQFKVQSN
jgi:hypothetical protein